MFLFLIGMAVMTPFVVGIDREVTRAMALAFYAALDQSGLPLKAVASAMGYTSAHQLVDQLAGRALLPEPRLLMLRWNRDADFRAFYKFYQHELRKHDGDEAEQEWAASEIKALLLRAVDAVQKRVPVKAELRETRAKGVA